MSLLQMSLSGAVMIAAILIVRAVAVNRLPKVTFLILWEIAILRLIIPFSFPSSVSVYSLLGNSRTVSALEEAWEDRETVLTQDMISTESAETAENVTAEGIPGAAGANADAEETANLAAALTTGTASDTGSAANRAAAVSAFLSAVPAWTLVWFAGALACAVFFLISYVLSRRKFAFSTPVRNAYTECWLSQHEQRRTVSIRQTDFISAPLTYGIVRPVILMPAKTNWEDISHLDYIFAHEYNHIRHFDTLKKLICVLALCIHWFNPFVWVLYLLYNRDIELACDESVVRGFGESSRREYALMLINMEAKKSGLWPLCNHFSKNSIEERIRAIMKTKKTTVGIAALSVAVVVVIAALFATSADSAAESSQTTEADDTGNAGADETLADAGTAQGGEGSGTETSETGSTGTESAETENTDAGTEVSQDDTATAGTDEAKGDADEALEFDVTGSIVDEEENADLYEQVRQLLSQRDYLQGEMNGGVAIDLNTTITVDDMTYCLVTEEGITSFGDYEALAEEIYTEDYVEQLFTPQYAGYFTEADGKLYRVNADASFMSIDEDSICIYQQGGTDGVYIVTANTDTDIIPVDGTTRIFVIQVNEAKPYGFEIRDEIELY